MGNHIGFPLQILVKLNYYAAPGRVDFRKIVVYSFFPFRHAASNEISPNPKTIWAEGISRYIIG